MIVSAEALISFSAAQVLCVLSVSSVIRKSLSVNSLFWAVDCGKGLLLLVSCPLPRGTRPGRQETPSDGGASFPPAPEPGTAEAIAPSQGERNTTSCQSPPPGAGVTKGHAKGPLENQLLSQRAQEGATPALRSGARKVQTTGAKTSIIVVPRCWLPFTRGEIVHPRRSWLGRRGSGHDVP